MQNDLKVGTEVICDAQEQALRTNYTTNKIDKTSENQLCRMCRERGETYNMCSTYVNVKN